MAKIRHKGEADDYMYRKTDEDLKDLEARLSSLYAKSSKGVEAKLDKFLEQYSKNDAEKRAMVADGLMSQKEYVDWRTRQMFTSNKMKAQIDALTEDMVHTDKLAMQMVNGELPNIYTSNYNFQGYMAESIAKTAGYNYSTFTLYNADAVAYLEKKHPNLLPEPKTDIPKDKRWNRQHIASAIAQGITQGDPVDEIAARLRTVTDMDKNAAIRNARTALIGAQNQGRKDAVDRINRDGVVPMVERWSCSIDARTRDTHLMLDGTEPNEDGLFGVGIVMTPLRYPADPNGDPEEVYNCRCRLMTFIKGIDHTKDKELYEQFMSEEYYADWERQKRREADHDTNAHMKKLEKEYAANKQAELKAQHKAKMESIEETLRKKKK